MRLRAEKNPYSPRRRQSAASVEYSGLLTDAELSDNSAVTLDILLLKVCKKIAAMTNHLKQTATAVVVLGVSLKMLVKRVDAVGKDSYLNLGGSGITLVSRISADDLLLDVLLECHSFSPLFIISYVTEGGQVITLQGKGFLAAVRGKGSQLTFYHIFFQL